MLTKKLRRFFGFDIWQKLKYPQNPHLTNFSSDQFDTRPSNAWVGRVFVPKQTARRDPMEMYINDAIKVVFNFFNKKYGNKFKLQQKDFDNVKSDTWFSHNIKLDQEIDEIVDNLCDEMILKEHTYRYAIEKINRKKIFEKRLLKDRNSLKSISVQEFIYEIARICEESVSLCKKSRDDFPIYNTQILRNQINIYLQDLNDNDEQIN